MDWRFASRPRWIASHVFAAVLIIGFVAAGLWQLDRREQRRASNDLITSRALVEPVSLAAAGVASSADLDFVAVRLEGRYEQGEVVRVANRSQDGRGGDWVVATFRDRSGALLLVNRGFVLRDESVAPVPTGEIELDGWLRATRTRGWLGARDSGEGDRVPRLNVDDIQARLGGDDLVDWWFQLATEEGVDPSTTDAAAALTADGLTVPRPVPLGDLDEGNHFSYAMQWFAFAALSIVIYGLMLRRLASRRPDQVLDVH